jgi:glyoxylase-like metal-dependent hydrolase (beta-lactamase superfamily II)
VCVPFEENTYVARLEQRNDCVVIDPGLEPERVIEHIEGQAIVPAAILITHAHADHIGGLAALKRRWPACPVVVGAGDAAGLSDPVANLSAMFGVPMVGPGADVTVNDGDTYSAAGLQLKVLAIPGHSPGHVVYHCEDRNPALVFVGDVIFAGGIGRTDFPGGDFARLVAGIRQKLFTLPDDTLLLPGHGPATTVGQEKRTNPFVAN